MRLVHFHRDQRPWQPGLLLPDGGVIDLVQTEPAFPTSVEAILAAGPDVWSAVQRTGDRLDAIVVENAQLGPPIARPEKIICVGLNYREHARETGASIPTEPVIFNKFPNALAGPHESLPLPIDSDQVDYEAELVVVIGKLGRRIKSADAWDHVFGFTIGNDVSARDWQKNKPGKQWLLGKSFDGFAPIGPAVVSRDEVTDPHALRIQCRLNGQTMQDSNTSDMIFSIPELIEYVSRVTTLAPGDLLFTGTPAGVGVARTPPVFLQPGDLCEIEIESLGVLRTRCAADRS